MLWLFTGILVLSLLFVFVRVRKREGKLFFQIEVTKRTSIYSRCFDSPSISSRHT